jgi:hypothetical protein
MVNTPSLPRFPAGHVHRLAKMIKIQWRCWIIGNHHQNTTGRHLADLTARL